MDQALGKKLETTQSERQKAVARVEEKGPQTQMNKERDGVEFMKILVNPAGRWK